MDSEEGKLFIGGISEETTRETLGQYFSHYGEVKHCLKVRDRGIGFVTFADPSAAENALQHDHNILGRQVDVKPARPRIEVHKRKIFVGGLPPDITSEEFRTYFGNYGPITDAVLIQDKVTRKLRGFGFVTFESEEAAENVLVHKFHVLKDKSVEVKMAKPKEKSERSSDLERRDVVDYGSVASTHIYHLHNQPNCPPRGRCYYVFVDPNGGEPHVGSCQVFAGYNCAHFPC